MSYEILKHTADEKFRAEGEDLEEAFSSAVDAFSTIVKGGEGSQRHAIKAEAESLENTLFDFLDRLIFLQDTEMVAVSHATEVEVEETEKGYRIEAEVLTDPITPGMNFTDVKAPTYNEMKADHQDGKWVLEAVLDI